MDFLQKMINYYQGETRHGFLVSITGIFLIGIALIGRKFINPVSIFRGFLIPFIVGGLFLGIAGAASGIFTKKSFKERMTSYQQDRSAFFKTEVSKVQKIHKSWLGTRTAWTMVGFAGLALLLLAKKNYLMGVGLGILLFGLIGHVIEAFSFHRNEIYRDAVIDAADIERSSQNKAGSEKQSELPISVAVKEETSKPSGISDTFSSSDDGVGQRDTLFLQSALCAEINLSTPKDTAAFLMANNLPAIKIGKDSSMRDLSVIMDKPGRKRKLLDYYNSDLIQKNSVYAKHCWFSKKYSY
ncbi:hypothetical protein [Mucilaginibacter endophyticus]|uniref:hypothetical protein n=1 Tax=Mucilaginibacter endophyticus TaxID=2675003 RepID=UPI000E0D8F9D|nr:hypothetical protein [Mucilaginibacter endophyticus]